MNQIEFEEKKINFNWKRLGEFLLCVCMILSSTETKLLATNVNFDTEFENVELFPSKPDTPDQNVWHTTEEDFYATALSNTFFRRKKGESVEMKVYAWSKSGTLEYTWYAPNGEEIENIHGGTLKIDNLDDDSFGEYKCIISDKLSLNKEIFFQIYRETRLFATLEVSYDGHYVGEKVLLKATAVDYNHKEQNLTYQWYKGTKKIQGATESEYSFRIDQKDQKKTITYRCMISNGEDTIIKSTDIYCPGYYYHNGIELIDMEKYFYCKAGDTVELNADAVSKYNQDGLTYQWYKGFIKENSVDTSNAEILENETNSKLIITADDTCFYSCVVSDGYYNAVYFKEIIVLDENSLFNIYGKMKDNCLTLYPILNLENLKNTNESDLSYQWYRISYIEGEIKKEIIPEETKKELVFKTLTEDDLGVYSLLISYGDMETAEAEIGLYKKSFSISSTVYAIRDNEETAITLTAAEGYTDLQLDGAEYQWYVTNTNNKNETRQPLTEETNRKLTVNYNNETKFYRYECDITIDGITCTADFNNYHQIQKIEKNSSDWAISCTDSNVKTIYYNRKYDTDTIQIDPKIIKGDNATLSYSWEKCIDQYSDSWEKLDYEGEIYELDMDEFDDSDDSIDDSSKYRLKLTVKDNSNRQKTIIFALSQEKTLFFDEQELDPPTHPIYNVDENKHYSYEFSHGSYSIFPGESITMHCKAFSTEADISYQWEKFEESDSSDLNWDLNWEAIEGAVYPDYIINSTSEDDSSNYRCKITDGNQTKYYNCFLSITKYLESSIDPPEPKLLFPGAENILLNIKKVTLRGEFQNIKDQCQYQWYKVYYDFDNNCWNKNILEESDRVNGVNTDTLTFKKLLPEDYSSYVCKITYKSLSCEVSADLYWNIPHWKCSGDSNNFYGELGESIYLYPEVYAPEEYIEYHWYHNEKEIPGATDSFYLLNLDTEEDFGNYYCKITVNGYPYDKQVCAYIYQNKYDTLNTLAKEHYQNYKNKRLSIGDTIDMGAIAYTTGNSLSYQWQVCTAANTETGYIFTDIPGATQPDYPLTIQSENDYGTYRCVVTCPDLNMEKYVLYGLYPPKQEQPVTPVTPDPGEKPDIPVAPKPDKPTQPDDSTQTGNKTVAVTNVILNKTSLEIEKGKKAKLTASVLPANATNPAITWNSSNPKVAAVTNGTVKAVKQGSAVITVTTKDGAKTATCNVKVTIPSTKVVLIRKKSLIKGESCVLKPALLPTNSTDGITWSSSNEKVATISDNGKVKAIAAGTAKITAKSDSGKKTTCTIYVVRKKISATKITLNRKTVTMKAEETLQLHATTTPQKSTDTLQWKSSNKKIAQVDENGLITPKRSGKVQITVKTSSRKKAVCKIKITQDARSIKLNKDTLTLKLNDSFQLKAKMTPSYSTNKLKWKSSNKKIVSVNKKGRIFGLKKGKAIITVTTSNKLSATCKVTVK